VPHALAAAETLDATVVNMRFVKPLDTELVLRLAQDHDALVTIEENVVMGGAGSGVAEALAAAGVTLPVLHLGLPDRFLDHGDPAELLAACGLDAPGIVAAVTARFPQRRPQAVVKPAA
jgi:1-deoxy-D-xylulose-5-phosphate synthase